MNSCECGCGQQVKSRFLRGHSNHLRRRESIKNYRAHNVNGRLIRTHRERAERALGRELRGTEQVHHADGTKSELSPLVICPDTAYHRLLHIRTRVVQAGGNPNTEKFCAKCDACKPFVAFTPRKNRANGLEGYCRECRQRTRKT